MPAAAPASPRSGLLLRVFWTLLALVMIAYPLTIALLMYTHGRWGVPGQTAYVSQAARPLYALADRVPALQQAVRDYAVYCVFLELARQPLVREEPASPPTP